MKDTSGEVGVVFVVIIAYLLVAALTDYCIYILGRDITYPEALLVTFWLGIVCGGSSRAGKK